MADSARLYIDPKNLQSIAYGTADPTVAGVALPMPSLYGKADTGQWYYKSGANATDWTAFGSASGTTWASITGKPTTIGGYGITDAFTSYGRSTADVNAMRSAGGYGLDSANANAPGSYLALLNVPNSDVGLQIAGGYTSDTLKFRGYYNSGTNFTAWRDVLHSGNYTAYTFPKGPNLALTGNSNPYISFSDGTYTAYWQMVSGSMYLAHNGTNRMVALSGGGMQSYGSWDFLKSDGSAHLVNIVQGDAIYTYLPIQTNGSGVYVNSGIVGLDAEVFTARGASVPHYGWRWTTTTDVPGDNNVRLLGGGYGGISLFTGGAERLQIDGAGLGRLRGVWLADDLRSNAVGVGAVGWWRIVNANTSPVSSRLEFGADGSGWAFQIGRNVGGTYTGLVTIYETGLMTLPMVEVGSSMTLLNGVPLYGRRADGAQVAMLRYDSGTDDLSMVIGGGILRWRDTGSGVPMSLTYGGTLDVLTQYNLAGVVLAQYSASYNMLNRRDGGIGIYLGGTDATNYYDNSGHIFRDRSGVNVLNMTTSRATLYTGLTIGESGEVIRVAPDAAGDSAYFTFFDNLNATRRAYIGLGGGSGAGAHFYINSDSGSVIIQANAGTPVAAFSASVGVQLQSSGQTFKDSFGNPMAPIIVSSSAASGTAADRTLWIQV